MSAITKYIPYIYFVIAGLLLMNSIEEFQKEQDSYRIMFSFETESSTTFLTIRIVFIVLIILAGFVRLKRLRDVSSRNE